MCFGKSGLVALPSHFLHCDLRTKVSNFDEVYVLHRKSLPKSSVMNVCSSRSVITVARHL